MVYIALWIARILAGKSVEEEIFNQQKFKENIKFFIPYIFTLIFHELYLIF
jgi:hypothetical protein